MENKREHYRWVLRREPLSQSPHHYLLSLLPSKRFVLKALGGVLLLAAATTAGWAFAESGKPPVYEASEAPSWVEEPTEITLPTTHVLQAPSPGEYMVTCVFLYQGWQWFTVLPFSAQVGAMQATVLTPPGVEGEECELTTSNEGETL